MRVANLDGRLVVVTGDAGLETAYDVEKNSGGQFRADRQAVNDDWDAFTTWAATAKWQDGVALRPEALGPHVPAPRQVFGIGLTTATTRPNPAMAPRTTDGDLLTSHIESLGEMRHRFAAAPPRIA
jgi:hypothetical protein